MQLTLRNFNHVITKSKSGKSVMLKIDIDDRFGKQTINFSSVKGWRCSLALKHLAVESDEWNDDVARKFVGLEVLRCAKNQYEGMQFLNILKNLSGSEVHFWASKFMTKDKARKAWRAFYA